MWLRTSSSAFLYSTVLGPGWCGVRAGTRSVVLCLLHVSWSWKQNICLDIPQKLMKSQGLVVKGQMKQNIVSIVASRDKTWLYLRPRNRLVYIFFLLKYSNSNPLEVKFPSKLLIFEWCSIKKKKMKHCLQLFGLPSSFEHLKKPFAFETRSTKRKHILPDRYVTF